MELNQDQKERICSTKLANHDGYLLNFSTNNGDIKKLKKLRKGEKTSGDKLSDVREKEELKNKDSSLSLTHDFKSKRY
jgi:hypothetical protein